MEKKINIAELLKDCPNGMELDCTMFDTKVIYQGLNERIPTHPIIVQTEHGFEFQLTQYGQIYNIVGSKCVIFPKDKTTWEGFVPPCKFNDGDIIADNHKNIAIYKGKIWYNRNLADFYCGYRNYDNRFLEKPKKYGHFGLIEELHLATEEEKQKLFEAIKENGYKWNVETKTLEKLIEQKFDITTLKPFDKVLVRDTNGQVWTADLFSHIMSNTNPNLRTTFVCVGHYPDQCIPFEGNEHLLGKTDDCDDFYKTWE